MNNLLRIEELEERIAPTVIAAGGHLDFTDADGDTVRISYDGPAASQVDALDTGGGNLGNNEDIGSLIVADSNFSSVLRVENLGGGDGQTTIAHTVHYVTAGCSTGLIALGVSADGSDAGTVVLSTGATIQSEGSIDTLVINGNIDFDTATHSITAAGDIGLIEVLGDMHLSAAGKALIYATPAGGHGDISFINVAGTVHVGTGGAALATESIGSGITIPDDVGDGTTGSLVIKVSGTGASGEVLAIPIIDGGNVVALVSTTDASAVTITSTGDGGDVTSVDSTGVATSLTVLGRPDTDLYFFSADDVGTVANKTVGGDIVGVDSAAGIAAITTYAKGNLGAAFTGTGNYYPAVIAGANLAGGYTEAGTSIGTINVGGVVNTSIDAASISVLTALKGGITGVAVETSAAIGKVQAAYIENSTIHGDTGIASVIVGAAGITNSTISARGDILTLKTPGSITDSFITAEFEDGGDLYGGRIGLIQAGAVYDSEFTALGGFDKVAVKGTFAASTLDAKFFDPGLAQDVGGPITSFSAGGIYDNSLVEAMTITSVTVGAGGINAGSMIDSVHAISKVFVKGDVTTGSTINSTDGITSVTIGGDLAYGARVTSDGTIVRLAVGGGIMSSHVNVGGDLSSLSVKGGIGGLFTTIVVDGDVGVFAVGGSIAGMEQSQAGTDLSTINIAIGGDVATFSVAGGVSNANIHVVGGLQTMSVGGAVTKGAFELDGGVNSLAVKHDVVYSAVTIGTAVTPAYAGKVYVGGAVTRTDLVVYGDVASLAVKGSMDYAGVDITGDLGAATIGRGVYWGYLRAQGHCNSIVINNSVQNSQTFFYGGVDNYTVKGSLLFARVGTTGYDVGGNPFGGRVGNMTVGDVNGTTISAFGGITSLTSKGTIYNASIETVGRDEDGLGDIVGGAGIGTLSAKGLNQSAVLAYTDIAKVTLGDEGMGFGSYMGTVGGDLGSLSTVGLLFGQIDIVGNIAGSILSAGDDAVQLGGSTYYLRDANGVITGGTVDVTGTVGGLIS